MGDEIMPTVMERVVAELPEVIVVAVRPPCDSFGQLTSRGAYYRDEMVRYLKGKGRLDIACCSEHAVDREIAKMLVSNMLASPALNECERKNDTGNTRAFLLQKPERGRSCRRILREVQQFVFRNLRGKGDRACVATGSVTASCIWKILTRNNMPSWCDIVRYDSPRPGSITIYERRNGHYAVTLYNVVPGEH